MYATLMLRRLLMVSTGLYFVGSLHTYCSPVVQFAKKTGDYAVLSHADICVLALTHSLHVREQASLENNPKEARSDESCITASI
jgi:rRNA maturation endonuclease Nob1